MECFCHKDQMKIPNSCKRQSISCIASTQGEPLKLSYISLPWTLWSNLMLFNSRDKLIFPGPMSGVIANISMPYDQRTSLDLMKYEFQCLWYAAHYQALRRSFGQDRCNKFLHSTALPPLGFCGIFPVDSVTMLPWWSYICPGKIYEKFATFQHTSIL